jgi:hypothetical protein
MNVQLTSEQFSALVQRLAEGWGTQETALAVSCFTPDAIYMQPPDVQFYIGHDQLRAYFGALRPGTYMHFQHVWFDEAAQAGCVEFSFGMTGKPTADHGTAVVLLAGGLIAHWREYVVKGPADFASFTAAEGKPWQWHIGNYP